MADVSSISPQPPLQPLPDGQSRLSDVVTHVPTRLPSHIARDTHSPEELVSKREELNQKAIPGSAWKHVAGFFGTLVFGSISLPLAIIPLLFAGLGKCIGWLVDDHPKGAEIGWKVGKMCMMAIPFALFPVAEASFNWLRTGGAKEVPKVEEEEEAEAEILTEAEEESLQQTQSSVAAVILPVVPEKPPQALPVASESVEVESASFELTETFLSQAAHDLNESSPRNRKNVLDGILEQVPKEQYQAVIQRLLSYLLEESLRTEVLDHLFNKYKLRLQ